MTPGPSAINIRHVAVIGAGAAGLVAARELRREGHSVTVFERGNQVGGTWVYTPEAESDPLSLDPTRSVVHSSLYASLRTQVPRECMGFRDYPFSTRPGESRDPRRFPGHREVLEYLREFAREFGVQEAVRFETEVVNVGLMDGGRWSVRTKSTDECLRDGVFDAVVVCSGHHTEPRIADIPGMDSWPGKTMHSHNYRVPEPFRDQVVVLIGSAASAAEISRDVSGVSKEVHVASRSVPPEMHEKQLGYDNIWLHSMIARVCEDGSVAFENGRVVLADVIIHCTGYKYNFPFLEANGIVTIDDNRIGPLYKHVFPPAVAPGLSFIGIPFKSISFPVFEYQSKWIAGVLSGRITLPSQKEMIEDIERFYSALEAHGVPKHYTHRLHGTTFEYGDWLATQCGVPGFEEWRKEMYYAFIKNWQKWPNKNRDEWEDDHLVPQAYEDFKKYTEC